MVKVINLKDGKLIKNGHIWVYTGDGGTFRETAHEALAEAYEVDANDVEVKILKFRNGTIKALICIEGWCELYDVEYEEIRWGVNVAKLCIEILNSLLKWLK